MSRPGFVLNVDAQTPPLVVFQGEKVLLERLPLGTSVIYPPDALPTIRSLDAEIEHSLLHPVGIDPLPALLQHASRVTIVFDDLSQPLTSKHAPDVRQRIIEHVLELAAMAEVDDLELIAATGLRRRMTPDELQRVLGERVFQSFFPDHLHSHDAEDQAALVEVGQLSGGEPVEINARVASSDLVISVRLATSAGSTGLPATATTLAGAQSVRSRSSLRAVPGAGSKNADLFSSLTDVIGEKARVFTIDVTLAKASTRPALSFLNKREREWTLADRALSVGLQTATRILGSRAQLGPNSSVGYGVTSIVAGLPSVVHPGTEAFLRQQRVNEVENQADIVLFGLADPDSAGSASVLNPVSAAALGLGQIFNGPTVKPVVRAGGTAIFYHPLSPRFHSLHHPSYRDFFAEVLAQSTDPAVLSSEYEEKFVADPWYRHLYRTSYAHHAVHPFHAWYSAAPAIEHLGEIIFVGGDRDSTARMGFKAASTLDDALEMASDSVGSDPSMTYVHGAPLHLAEVS